VTIHTACKHCAVPVDNGDTCAFCATYVPPETADQRLDVLVNRVDLIRHDANIILDRLPADAPLFACADLTTAICHLKRASVLFDRAAAQLEGAAEVDRTPCPCGCRDDVEKVKR
jgi:hypothetical protein